MHLQEAIYMDQFLNLFISNLVCSPTSARYNKMTQPCPQGVLHTQVVPSSSPKLQYQNTAILCSLLSNPPAPSLCHRQALCNPLRNLSELSPVGARFFFSGFSETIFISNNHLFPKAYKHTHVFLTACPALFCLFNVG